jgi:hypothetical protein
MTEVNIRRELKVFRGTSGYHKHLYPGKSPILLTDGCKFVRDECKAYWLFDKILKYQETVLKSINFQIWELKQQPKDLTWLLSCKEDTERKPIVSETIKFKDFPVEYIRILVIGRIALLPTEY